MANNQDIGIVQRKRLTDNRTPEQLLLEEYDRKQNAPSGAGQLKMSEGQVLTDSAQDSYRELLDRIVNREGFSYDREKDPVWNAYAKAYRREGDRAAEDALAAASAATGGVPSSYAVTAASQAGDYYAAQLADKAPELEQSAYQRYLQELDLDYQALNALQTERNFDYNRYLQEYEQDQQEFANALALYQTLGYMTPEIEAALGIQKKGTNSAGQAAVQNSGTGQTAVQIGNTGNQNGTSWKPDAGATDETEEPAGGVPDNVLLELSGRYPGGRVTDPATWRELAKLYGEDAVAAKGFYFGADFNGVTRDEAVKYLTGMGVPYEQAQKTIGAETWRKMKEVNAPDGYIRGNNTYEDYLWNWVTDMVLKHGK